MNEKEQRNYDLQERLIEFAVRVYGSQPAGTRAVALFDSSIRSDALNILARNSRVAEAGFCPIFVKN